LASGQDKVKCAANTAVRHQRSVTAAVVGREGKLTSDVVRKPVALRSQKNHKQIQEILILVRAEGLNKMGSIAEVLNMLMNKNG